jgi:hypothetical protein
MRGFYVTYTPGGNITIRGMKTTTYFAEETRKNAEIEWRMPWGELEELGYTVREIIVTEKEGAS